MSPRGSARASLVAQGHAEPSRPAIAPRAPPAVCLAPVGALFLIRALERGCVRRPPPHSCTCRSCRAA
eukprot:13086254-Alexandrium_andersonii.AAC.1